MSSQFVDDLQFLAKVYGWEMKWHKPEYAEIHFKRDGCGLTIWYSKMTVRTALTHPKLGETQMFRKRVDMNLMEKIFDNPRQHTNKGYISKKRSAQHRWRKTNNTDVNQLNNKISNQLKNIRERYQYNG